MARSRSLPLAPKLYEFVPLADAVFDVPWAQWVNHDYPLKDGWCGELVVTAEAHTPILVSSDKDGTFFRVGDSYALSSTGVRGMLRSVLEIASFGRVTQIRKTPKSDGKKCPRPLELRDYLPMCHTEIPEENAADFVETLLGYVAQDQARKPPARRSRVSIKDFRLTPPEPTKMAAHQRQLYGPRPDDAHARYVDFSSTPEVARGHKVFPVKTAIDGDKTGRSFKALPAGASFTGSMVLHNVLPVELGGLLWAFTWGGDAAARHLLGRAKPYGFGALTLTVDWNRSDLRSNDPARSETSADAAAQALGWQTTFIDQMNEFTKVRCGSDWLETPPMQALLRWAVPAS